MRASGKLVIFGIVAVAVAAAGASWWFRYSATHRAARFWGSQASQLIRDAPIVELYSEERLPDSAFRSGFAKSHLDVADGRDISHAPGLTHLRNALLEDHSYQWPAECMVPGRWGWVLVFRDSRKDEVAVLMFTSDWEYVGTTGQEYIVSCKPISSGLAKFVAELSSNPVAHER